MGAPGLAFETWDPPSKGSSSPLLLPKEEQLKRDTATQSAAKHWSPDAQ
jgi:hypothetical protein